MSPRALLIALVAALPLVATATAQAAPLNDNRAQSALVAPGGQTLSGSNLNATVEPISAEVNMPGTGNRSVWYRWTPSAPGLVTIEVSSFSFDPAVGVFPVEWDVTFKDNLDISAADDDARVTFYAKAGHQYDLMVDGETPGASGSFTIAVSHDTTPPPPPNDDFGSAQVISGQDVIAPFNTVYATDQLSEVAHRGQTKDHSVWFSWTAPATGGVNVKNSCYANEPWDMFIGEPVLAVYTGQFISTLSFVSATDTNLEPSCPHGSLQFKAIQGTTYRIAAASISGHDEGYLVLDQDSTPPVTTIGIPSVTGRTPAISLSASGVASYECQLDGQTLGTCSGKLGPLAAGQHTFKARATDWHGNVETSWKSKTFTVDATPAETQITGGPSGDSSQFKDVQIPFASEAGATFRCQLDAYQVNSCTSPYKIPSLGAGEHTLKVWATDPYGNEDPTPATRTWRVDYTAPHIDWYSVPHGIAPNTAFSVTFKVSEAAATECAFDGAPLQPCTTPHQQPAGLPTAGDHVFRVRATDAAGNVGERTVNIRVTAPYAPYVPPATGTTGTTGTSGTAWRPGTTSTAPRPFATVASARFLSGARLRVGVRASGAMPVRIRLTAGRKTLLDVRRRVGAGVATFTIPLSRSARAWLAGHRRVRVLQLRLDGAAGTTPQMRRIRR